MRLGNLFNDVLWLRMRFSTLDSMKIFDNKPSGKDRKQRKSGFMNTAFIHHRFYLSVVHY